MINILIGRQTDPLQENSGPSGPKLQTLSRI